MIAESHGASVAHYDLLPDRNWECDLSHVERIIASYDEEGGDDGAGCDGDEPDGGSTKGGGGSRKKKKVVRGILVNNPSNPTGAVYGRDHLSRIAELAERRRVPVVSDEIYGDMTFGGKEFHPMADVAASLGYRVPVITASGLGKQCKSYWMSPALHFSFGTAILRTCCKLCTQ